MAHAVAYRIHAAGPLDPRLVDWFDGLVVEHSEDGNSLVLTPPIDQAALRGQLSALFNLNVRVIAVVPRSWESPRLPA